MGIPSVYLSVTLFKLLRILIIIYTICLLVICIGLGEVATRVHPGLRSPTPEELADSIAQSTGGQWRKAETRSFDGTLLSGWLFTPQQGNGHAVIALHGVGDTRRGVLGLARMLVRHGYMVLTPDSRGHGISGGDFITYGVLERKDNKAWVAWLDATVHPKNVYGLGESMGAAILIQSLPEAPRIKAAVAEASFHTFEEVGYERVKQVGLGTLVPWPMLEPSFLYARLRHGVNLKLASPSAAVRQTKTPILFIAGTADHNIDEHHSKGLFREAVEGSEFWEMPGVDHVQAFSASPKEFERRVVDWFALHQ